jgi:cysteine desulfurase/selenocysteine lyase
MFDSDRIRSEFPQLSRKINQKRLIYLDSTATSLKPQAVLDAVKEYYTRYGANVFRGIYKISEEATAAYESAREKIARFIHAHAIQEVVYTRSTDESISLVYYSWALPNVREGDEVVTTIMEHHANFVPWQQLAKEKNIELRIWNVNEDGKLKLQELDTLITKKTKLLAVTAVSNVAGTINPVREICRRVKRINPKCLVLVDAAQAAPHMSIDVSDWGADFVAFSSHKMLGPTGMGVLWGRKELLESMPPFNFGGDMIKEVHRDSTVFNDIPHKFEAGTPHIAGAIGLGAAVDYLAHLGMDAIRAHEEQITSYALRRLSDVRGLSIVGTTDAKKRGGVIAFRMQGIHPHDIAQVLDEDNICIRVGFHCAQPLHEFLGIGPTARASFYIYNTTKDVDALIEGLKKVQKVFV